MRYGGVRFIYPSTCDRLYLLDNIIKSETIRFRKVISYGSLLTVGTYLGDKQHDLNHVGRHSRKFVHSVHWIVPTGTYFRKTLNFIKD